MTTTAKSQEPPTSQQPHRPQQQQQCTKCKKPDSAIAVPLKRCAKCKDMATLYCSRGCQTADWKRHKKACASNAATQAGRAVDEAAKARLDPAVGAARHATPVVLPRSADDEWEDTASEDGEVEVEEEESEEEDDDEEEEEEDLGPLSHFKTDELLDKLPEIDVYKLLVGTFQHYKQHYLAEHGRAPDNLPHHFCLFLDGLQEDGLLPGWWCERTRGECETVAEAMRWAV